MQAWGVSAEDDLDGFRLTSKRRLARPAEPEGGRMQAVLSRKFSPALGLFAYSYLFPYAT